jgi:hypothetical protein
MESNLISGIRSDDIVPIELVLLFKLARDLELSPGEIDSVLEEASELDAKP